MASPSVTFTISKAQLAALRGDISALVSEAALERWQLMLVVITKPNGWAKNVCRNMFPAFDAFDLMQVFLWVV